MLRCFEIVSLQKAICVSAAAMHCSHPPRTCLWLTDQVSLAMSDALNDRCIFCEEPSSILRTSSVCLNDAAQEEEKVPRSWALNR